MSDALVLRDEEMLGELAELDLALAKAAYSRAMAAETPEEFAALSRAYQRCARSCRQSIALRDKLQRLRREAAKADPPPKPPRDVVRIAERKAELRAAVGKVIFNETEGERQDYLWELLDNQMSGHLPDDWGTQPLDRHVLEVCAAYGLPLDAARRWRELPEVDYGDDAEEPDAPAEPQPALADSG